VTAETVCAAGRCLCELAKQIGFMDEAQDVFKLEEQLSTFRHVVSGHLTTEGNCKIIIQFFNCFFFIGLEASTVMFPSSSKF
jgi:hypothetical protein